MAQPFKERHSKDSSMKDSSMKDSSMKDSSMKGTSMSTALSPTFPATFPQDDTNAI